MLRRTASWHGPIFQAGGVEFRDCNALTRLALIAGLLFAFWVMHSTSDGAVLAACHMVSQVSSLCGLGRGMPPRSLADLAGAFPHMCSCEEGSRHAFQTRLLSLYTGVVAVFAVVFGQWSASVSLHYLLR